MAQGSVTSLGKGLWLLRWDGPRKPDGSRNQIKKRFRGTKAAAEDLVAQLRLESKNGAPPAPKSFTVAEFAERYLTEIAPLTARSPNTVRGYRNYLRGYLVPRFGSLRLGQLDASMIQSMYSDLLKNGRTKREGSLSRQSVYHCHVIVNGMMKQAVNLGLIRENPCDRVKAPRPEKKQVRALTRDELVHLLTVTRGTAYEVAAHLAGGAGLRLGEFLALEWKEVDFERNEIVVLQSALSDDGRILTKPPKSETSVRVVPMAPFVREALLRHREEQAKEKQKPGYQDRGLVSANAQGGYVLPNTMSRAFSRLLKQLGMKGVTLHSLRHTFATLLLENGGDLKVVSELMGHSRTSVTNDIYYHTQRNQHHRLTERLDQIVKGTDEGHNPPG